MEAKPRTTKRPNPVQEANPLSEITFVYMFPIFIRTMKEKLTEDNLYLPLREHKSSRLGSNLERIFKEEFRIHKKTALHRALFKLLCWPFILLGISKLFTEIMLIVVLPLTIGKLVSYFERGQTRITDNEAYIYAAALILCLLVDCFVSHPAMMGLQHLSMKLRIATSSLLYRKILRISKSALGTVTVGQLVNLLSNDVSKFDQGFILAHFVWVGPIQVAVGTWLLYSEIGPAAYFGVAFLVSFVPLQMWLAKRVSIIRLRTAVRTDERVRLMDEVIAGIQVIKMYCWEKPFAQLVSTARSKEMKAIKAHSCILGFLYSFEQFVSRTSIFISILGYVMLGNYVTAEKIFAITALYNVMRPVITILFSISLTSIAEVNISIRRVQEVLACDERTTDELFIINEVIKNGTIKHDKSTTTTTTTTTPDAPPRIELKQVRARWTQDSPEDTLQDINLSVTESQLLAIVGPVGSGKSSIINLLLKELPVRSGHLEVVGRVSYSSQEPWLFSGSIRQNILFGEEYDEERYQAVVEVCALRSDFAMFSHGDKTLVGEKGKSLSGGQKARINLARCVYKQADIYLLDDPLSAVDANVGKHLYEKCIRSFLSRKICVLVTHQLQYLKSADNIIIMSNGAVQLEGKYNELQRSGLDFAQLLEEFHTEEVEDEKKKIKSRQNSEMDVSEDEEEEQTLEKERQSTGRIKKGVYWKYFRAGGGTFTIVFLILLFFFSQAVANGGEYFVTYWVNLEEKLSNDKGTDVEIDRNKIVYWYTALTVGAALIAIAKEVYFLLFLAAASRNLHDFIFARIIRATMMFYNSNPSGRILNRFSKDLGVIDEYIPSVMIDIIEIALLLGGTIVLSSIVDPWLLLPSTGLILLFYFLRLIYIETSRSVKRVESITKSPVFSHVTATVNGLSTIRASSAEGMLIREFDDLQDTHSSAWFLFIASSRCFGFWLDLICIAFIAIGLSTLLIFNDKLQGGDLGLVLTQYIGLMGSLQWGMRQWSELENQMTSVERILEYTELESEPEREDKPLPVDWPREGRIEFIDVKLRYSESDPYVLKGLNFVVSPEEKVGIVGRTGAGKSSTISALFQLYRLEGRILIDDVDTTLVPLHRARPVIAIIPQEPILFSGTMRRNLDPFEEYGDEVLWRALEQVELKDVVSELPSGLNTNVNEGGANFSVGQRQLVCLARALIRNNKILVLDEATANVDPHTDGLIQQTIRDKFRNCTVLTIAHRLHTVMDSDKILVMEAGSVVEYAHPYELLQKERGTLRTLVDTTGPATAKNLENIAKESYRKKKTE